jgi:hypothetical protein
VARANRLPLAIEPDVDGPKVRLGVLWLAVTVGAALVDQLALAVVLAVAAGLAADQVVRLQRDRAADLLADPVRLPAVLAAAALPLAATAGTDTVVAAAVGAVLVTLVHRTWSGPVDGAVADVALVVVAALPVGLGAAAPVLVAELAPAAAVVLLVLVAAYDAGDFMVGTGAGTPWEGPVAGIVAVAVCGFAAWVVAPPPLEGHGVVALAVATAVLAPLGPPAASVLVGDAATPARFVRRLDTLVVLGPVAAWAAAGVVAR